MRGRTSAPKSTNTSAARGAFRPDHRRRVVVKAPSGHHRTGGLYEITIHLSLPEGREVNIGRTPQDDERYADIDYALNDAFKRARRQLQDEVRKIQGQVKHHEGSA